MALRCKPGDVAMVSSPPWWVNSCTGERIKPVVPFGTFVTVFSADEREVWTLAEPIAVSVDTPLALVLATLTGLGDKCLTPYRPWEQPTEREPEHIDRRQDREIPVGEGYEVLTVSGDDGIAHAQFRNNGAERA